MNVMAFQDLLVVTFKIAQKIMIALIHYLLIK